MGKSAVPRDNAGCNKYIRKTRKCLDLKDKVKVIELLNEKKSEQFIATLFGVSKLQIHRLRANKENQIRGIQNFKASDGWFRNWRNRCLIGHSLRLFGEAGDVNLN